MSAALEDFAGARAADRSPSGPELGVVDPDAVAGAALSTSTSCPAATSFAHSRRQSGRRGIHEP